MTKNIGKQPKTLLGTVGTLLLALLIYFLQGGKASTPEEKVPEAPSDASAAVERVSLEGGEVSVAVPAAASVSEASSGKAAVPPPSNSLQPQKRQRSHWHQSNLQRHWEKHQAEFPEYKSAAEYGDAAVELVDNPPEGTLRKTSQEGDQMFYHPPSNRFAVVTADGTLKTCFKPEQGIRYWNRQ